MSPAPRQPLSLPAEAQRQDELTCSLLLIFHLALCDFYAHLAELNRADGGELNAIVARENWQESKAELANAGNKVQIIELPHGLSGARPVKRLFAGLSLSLILIYLCQLSVVRLK